MKELIDLLTDIQGKVTVSAPIRSGECVEPETEGDWYLYQENQAQTLNGFNDIFAKLSEQIEGIHKDACKAVQHKIELPELPPPLTCEINQETGEMQVVGMSTEQMGLIGLVPPWVIPSAGGAVVSWLTEKVLDWMFKSQQEQQKHTFELLCNAGTGSVNSDCSVLLPDPSAVWNTEGYYIFFHWKIENPTTEAEEKWARPSQLASPIDELINPEDPDAIWNQYFKDIYRVLGNQWAELRSKNKAKRYPMYSGWFENKDEARRFFNSIKPLTTIEPDTKNNPSFPDKDNPSIRLVNQGKKLVLRKVCVGLKHIDTDKTDILRTYAPPK